LAAVVVPSLDLFQHTILLTEGMNTLKCCLNAEKQSRHENPNHLDTISSVEEELQVPMPSIPITVVPPSPPATGASVETSADAVLPTPSPTDPEPTVLVHIPTAQLSVDSTLSTGPHTQPHLTTSKWLFLIAKAQMDEVPLTTGDLLADPMVAMEGMVVASPPCQNLHSSCHNILPGSGTRCIA